jgi:hypothetical protein
MQKLLPLVMFGLIISSSANAESKTSFSYISTSTDLTYSIAKISLDMDGFAIGTTVDISEQFFLTGTYSKLSGTASASLSGTTIATGNLDQDTLTLGAGINLINDLDRQAGTGSNLKTALAYSKTDLGTLSANNTLIGLNYDFAVAKKVSINTTFSGVIDDFNPAYGVGIAYSLGGGDLYASYAFTEDNVAGIKIEDSALSIGYSLNF